MKILFITNALQPPAASYMGVKRGPKGGWVSAAIKEFVSNGHSVFVASLYDGKQLFNIEIDGVTYFCVPTKDIFNYDRNLEKYWLNIKSQVNPDITHIFGTEFPMTLSYLKACGSEKVLVSIQGMVSRIAEYYLAGIGLKDRIKNLSLMSLSRHINMDGAVASFQKRGLWEKEALSIAKYVEGRTNWDRDNALAINSNLVYFSCNRTLRDSFYTHKKWSLNECEKHSIFVSQGRTPLKGLHKVIEAVALVKKTYPDVKIYVTNDIDLEKSFWYNHVYENDYINFIKQIIKHYGMEKNVVSTGLLNEPQMADRFQKSHVFVSASSIENSPNSVAEAQMLGVPCIGSYVGGTMDMIEHGKTGYLYRFEEVNMLAALICRVFEGGSEIETISRQEIELAESRHNKKMTMKTMLDIYNTVVNEVNVL